MKVKNINFLCMPLLLLIIAGCGGEFSVVPSVKSVTFTCDGGSCEGEVSATAEICAKIEPTIEDPSAISVSLTCEGGEYTITIPEPVITQESGSTTLCYSGYEQLPQVTTCTVVVSEAAAESENKTASAVEIGSGEFDTRCATHDDFKRPEKTLKKCWNAMFCMTTLHQVGGSTCFASWERNDLTGDNIGWENYIERYFNFKTGLDGFEISQTAAYAETPGLLVLFKSLDNVPDIKIVSDLASTKMVTGFEGGEVKGGEAAGDSFGVGIVDNVDPRLSCSQVSILKGSGVNPKQKEVSLLTTQINWNNVNTRYGFDETELGTRKIAYMQGLHSFIDTVGLQFMGVDPANLKSGIICGYDLAKVEDQQKLVERMAAGKTGFTSPLNEDLIDLLRLPTFEVSQQRFVVEKKGSAADVSFEIGYGPLGFADYELTTVQIDEFTQEAVAVSAESTTEYFDEVSGLSAAIFFKPAVPVVQQGQAGFQWDFVGSINVVKAPAPVVEEGEIGTILKVQGFYPCGAQAKIFGLDYSETYLDPTPAKYCE